MGKGDIAPKISLEGEREFARQIKDAAESVKTLDSELKLAKAEFENTGDAQQYAADKARILKEQMQAQQKAVDAAQKAVDTLKAKGVDPTSKAMQTWNTRLNTAKTRLLNMQTQLNSTEGELKEQGKAVQGVSGDYEDLLSTTQSVDRKISLEQAISAVDNLREKVEGVIKAGARAVKALWSWETDAGKWADDLATAASQAGVDVETYQSWSYASMFIDTEVDKIISARTKLTKKLGSLSDEDAKAFNEILVSTRNADDSVRDATDVFFDVIDALGRYQEATEREIHAQKIFGDSWKELQPLIEAGSKAYQDMAAEGREVAVVSEEQVQALAEWNDAQNKLNAVFNKTKYTLLAELAPAFKDAAEAMSTALTAFNQFLETDEGQAALQSLGDAFSGVVNKLTEADAKKAIDDAAGAVRTLTGALGWISENGTAVQTALIAIGASWAGLKLTGDVLRFVQGVEAFKGLVGKGAGSAASAASGAASAAGGGFFSKSAGFGISIGSLLQGGAAAYGLYKADELYASLPGGRSAIKDIGYNLGLYNYTPHSESGQQIYESIRQAVADGMNAADFTKQKYGSESLGEYYAQKNETFARWDAEGRKYNKSQTLENAYAQLEKLANEAAAKLEEASEAAGEKGKEAVENFTGAMEDNAQQAVDAAQQMGQSVTEETDREMSFMELIGENAATGLANGIDARAQDAVNAATRLANQVEAALQNALDIHSPSRVMERLGGFVTQGFAQGIGSQIDAVDDAVHRMARAAVSRPVRTAAEAPRPAAAADAGTVHVTMVLNDKQVGETFGPLVDGYIGAQLRNARL